MAHLLYVHFREGGWGMWPLACWFTAIASLAVERAWVLWRAGLDATRLLEHVERAVAASEVLHAAQLCTRADAPAARVIHAGLLRAGEPRAHVEAALVGALLREVPPLERRTDYLPVLGNLGMLTGLLGTITGLIPAYGCIGGGHGGPSIDPGRKAELLAAGISEAMNCTAFGLVIAIAGVTSHALLIARTRRVLVSLDDAATATLALLAARSPDDPSSAGPYRKSIRGSVAAR